MALKEDKIKNLFSSKLKNFEAEVPMSIWEGIEKQLPTAKTTTGARKISKKNKQKVNLAIALTTIAATLAIVFTVLPTDAIKEDASLTDSKPANKVEQPITDNTSPVAKEEPKTMETGASEYAYKNAYIARNATDEANTTSTQQEKAVANTMAKAFAPPTLEQKHSQEENRGQVATSDDMAAVLTPSKKNQKEDLPDNLPYKVQSDTQSHTPNNKKKSPGIGLNLKGNAGLLASNMSTTGNSDMLFSSEMRSSSFMNLVSEEHKEVKLKHRQPVSVGILVAKQLTPRLSIETGIMYSYLSSKSSTSELGLRDTQKFDYLGVPVNVNYTFYSLGKLNFYATVGALVQKDVQGTMKSRVVMEELKDYVVRNNELRSTEPTMTDVFSEPELIKKNIHQPNLQVSLHTTVGASYPIYKALHLYGTLGGAYYIDAKNKYETIYSDKKTQIDINLGLKLNF